MKLILGVYNPSELSGFNYGFVDLNPSLAQLILKRRDVFRAMPADDKPEAIEYRGYEADFLSRLPDGAAAEQVDDGGDYEETAVPEASFADHIESTECNRMVITEGFVYWTAYPKHCDRSLAVETNQIDLALVEQIANPVPA